MQLYQTVKNNDGTFSCIYTTQMTDVNGQVFECVCETHTKTLEEFTNDINATKARAQSFQADVAFKQAQIDAINALG